MELSEGGSLPNLVPNCRWTIVTDRHSWKLNTQNAFSLPFAAILVNCAPSGEMHNYCTPHIIKENSEYFLIHQCNYILLSQVYCVWQVVRTPTIISNSPVFSSVWPSMYCLSVLLWLVCSNVCSVLLVNFYIIIILYACSTTANIATSACSIYFNSLCL